MSSFKEYDKAFDEWFTEVARRVKFMGSLEDFYNLTEQSDPYGFFDSQMTAEQFAEILSEDDSPRLSGEVTNV